MKPTEASTWIGAYTSTVVSVLPASTGLKKVWTVDLISIVVGAPKAMPICAPMPGISGISIFG